MLHDDTFNSQPIRFLVVDLSKVDGVDFSSAEAFTRINRILKSKNVRLVLCGFSAISKVGASLSNVGLLSDEEESEGVEYFESLNSALEFCENELLRAFYQRKDAIDRLHSSPKFLGMTINY